MAMAWEGTGKREEEAPCRDYKEGICYVSFPPPTFFVLFLRGPLFVPFSSSLSAFVWEDPGVFFSSTQSFSGT